MHRLRLLPAFATALVGLAACTGAGDSSPQAAIEKFVAGEDGGFASDRGAFRAEVKGLRYYESSLALPGASNCAIYTTKSGAYGFGTCDFLASNAAGARGIYDDWKQKTMAAEPSWRSGEAKPPLDGHVATFQALDDRKHAIYLYIAKEPGLYRVTETFATR
jgi:hypothetical protein